MYLLFYVNEFVLGHMPLFPRICNQIRHVLVLGAGNKVFDDVVCSESIAFKYPTRLTDD